VDLNQFLLFQTNFTWVYGNHGFLMVNHFLFFKGFKYLLTSKTLGETMLYMVFYKQYHNTGFFVWVIEAQTIDDAIAIFTNKAKKFLGNVQTFYITPKDSGKWVNIK